MGSSEKSLVPEWYKSEKGLKSSNAISVNNGNGSSSWRSFLVHVNNIESSKVEERDTSSRIDRTTSLRGEAYSNFGRRDKKKIDDKYRNYPDSKVEGRSDIDSWRKNKESGLKNSVLSGQNVNNSSTVRPSSFKRNFPTLNNVQKNGVIATASDMMNLNKVGDENWTSVLAEVPKSISRSKSTGKNMVEALTQAPKIQTPNEIPADTSRADELEVRRCMQLIPVTFSMHKSSGLSSSEKPKIRQSMLPNKSGLASLQTEISKKPQIGNLKILTRGKNGTVIPIDNPLNKEAIISQDCPKSTPNPNLKVESKCTSTVTTLKRTASVSQKKRKDFFDSIRKINTVQGHTNNNTADKSSSLDTNNETCDDKVMDEKEVNTVKKKLENCEINADECSKQEVAELDEKDKVFMRSLGWIEEEVVEPLTQEEIDAFINKYAKLMPKSKSVVRFDAANSSPVQTS